MTTLTQGGQTSIHSFRMSLAITRFIVRFFVIMFIITLGLVFYTKTDKQTLRNTHNYYEARLISLYQKDLNHEITIKDGVLRRVGNQNLFAWQRIFLCIYPKIIYKHWA